VFLPGITDTALLKAASELYGQTAFREKGHEHNTRHDICDPAMLRELPDGYALLVRGGRAPVLAKLPRAWADRAYKRARRQGRAIYQAPAPAAVTAARQFTCPHPRPPPGLTATATGLAATATGRPRDSRGAVTTSDRPRPAERRPPARRNRAWLT